MIVKKEKPFWKAEWFKHVVGNVLIAGVTATIDIIQQGQLPLGAWAPLISTVLLSAVRMLCKTQQDKEIIKKG